MDPRLIGDRLPNGFVLDTYKGNAFLSIVPFRMSQVRFPFSPILPYSNLWELNIRTYIRVNGVPGIYFFTLDTDHFLAALIAKSFFALPYRYTSLKGEVQGNHYVFKGNTFHIEGKVKESIQKTDFHQWITERYRLFTIKNGRTLEGTALHNPWEIRNFEVKRLNQNFLDEFLFKEYEFDSLFAGDPLIVRFKPFVQVETGEK